MSKKYDLAPEVPRESSQWQSLWKPSFRLRGLKARIDQCLRPSRARSMIPFFPDVHIWLLSFCGFAALFFSDILSFLSEPRAAGLPVEAAATERPRRVNDFGGLE